MLNRIAFLIIALLFSACAASYKNLKLESEAFYEKASTKNFDFNYKYNILSTSGNAFFARKENRKGLKLVGVKLENKSNDTIFLLNDLQILSNGKNLEFKTTEESYKLLKQKPVLHLLEAFSIVFYSQNGFQGGGIFISPIGIFFAIPNVLIAANANNKMYKDFSSYNILKLKIPPHKEGFALLCFESRLNPPLEAFPLKRFSGDSVIFQKAVVSKFSIDSILYFSQKYSSFNEYFNTLESQLKQDQAILEIRLDQGKYTNGNPKYAGLTAKHLYGANSDYPYMIGTWRYYYKNGQLKEYIDYDLKERKNGSYKKYDEQGNIIQNVRYEENIMVINNVNTETILAGKVQLILLDGNKVDCEIIISDQKSVYINVYLKGDRVDTKIDKSTIKRILYK